MELIFELLFQLVFELFGEVLFEAGFRSAARVARSKIGRFTVASAAGFLAGFWWGYRLSEAGRVNEPRTLWISLALAAVAGLPLRRVRDSQRRGRDGVAVGFQPHPLR